MDTLVKKHINSIISKTAPTGVEGYQFQNILNTSDYTHLAPVKLNCKNIFLFYCVAIYKPPMKCIRKKKILIRF